MNGAMSVGTNHKPVTCFDINNLAVNVELALAAQNAINFFILLMGMDERNCSLRRKFINRNFAAGQAKLIMQFDTRCVLYIVNFQRFPTLDAKKLVNAPKMSAHHRGICHF